jgi:phasin family protein
MPTQKGNSSPTENNSVFNDFTKLMFQFPATGIRIDQLITSQRRNYETIARATQLTAESLNTVFRRQVAIAGQVAEDGANGIRQLMSAGAPKDQVALQADLMKTALEKGLANFREVSDILVKANADTAHLLTERVSESLSELKGAVAEA